VWIERQLELIDRYKPMAWFGETGVIRRAIEPMLLRRMAERRLFCRMEWLPSISDKPTRARPFQSMAASGRVYFEPGADLAEHLTFPAGKYDDDVDCSSLIGRALDQAHPALVPAAWDDEDDERDRGRSSTTGY
jgi:predicted phage terminase large subunit-like protein